MRTDTIVALVAAIAMAAWGSPPATTAVAMTPDPCRPEVERQLGAWQVVGPPRRQPPVQGGAAVTHWPTDTVGVWVVETRGEEATSLVRVTPQRTTEVMWSSTCIASTVEHARAAAAEPRFTDDELRRVMAEHERGVIYLWSPHMPLSIDGLDSVWRAASSRGLTVTVVLNPDASRTLAAAIAAERGWPLSTLQASDSVELTFRALLIHAPAVQAHVDGRLVGSPFPGYHSVDEYAAYFDRVSPG